MRDSGREVLDGHAHCRQVKRHARIEASGNGSDPEKVPAHGPPGRETAVGHASAELDMKRPEPLRAIILARVSTKHASQDTSPERKTARLEALALERGWRVVDRIVERHSGTGVTSRPAVAGALDKIIANKADVLLVDHLFRL